MAGNIPESFQLHDECDLMRSPFSGLNILTGMQPRSFSLGHGAFYAVGAYTAAIMMEPVSGIGYLWTTAGCRNSPWAFIVAFLFGFRRLRLGRFYLALVRPSARRRRHVTATLQVCRRSNTGRSGVMGSYLPKRGDRRRSACPLKPDQWAFIF